MKLLNYHVILVRDKNLLIFSIQDFSFKFKITNTFNINNLATSSDYLLFADTNHYLHLYDSEFKKTNSFPI